MSLIKYYDALFENEKLNSEYVTYLSAIHMMNTISKRDNNASFIDSFIDLPLSNVSLQPSTKNIISYQKLQLMEINPIGIEEKEIKKFLDLLIK